MKFPPTADKLISFFAKIKKEFEVGVSTNFHPNSEFCNQHEDHLGAIERLLGVSDEMS